MNNEQGAQSQDRAHTQIRTIELNIDALGYASASVLLSQGNTKVLVSVTLQPGVPHFLKGQQVGWLSAEYAMLPCATQQRTQREATAQQRNARSVEISRLIGRCLRTCVDLSVLRERTIIIDCDVLQADGGTRVACLTAASIALEVAYKRWVAKGLVDKRLFKERIAAISAGRVDGKNCVDLSFEEDSVAHADFNFVITESGMLVEVQGTAEKEPLAWEHFDELKMLAQDGVKQIFAACSTLLQNNPAYQELVRDESKAVRAENKPSENKKESKAALFSLANRITKS